MVIQAYEVMQVKRIHKVVLVVMIYGVLKPHLGIVENQQLRNHLIRDFKT